MSVTSSLFENIKEKVLLTASKTVSSVEDFSQNSIGGVTNVATSLINSGKEKTSSLIASGKSVYESSKNTIKSTATTAVNTGRDTIRAAASDSTKTALDTASILYNQGKAKIFEYGTTVGNAFKDAALGAVGSIKSAIVDSLEDREENTVTAEPDEVITQTISGFNESLEDLMLACIEYREAFDAYLLDQSLDRTLLKEKLKEKIVEVYNDELAN